MINAKTLRKQNIWKQVTKYDLLVKEETYKLLNELEEEYDGDANDDVDGDDDDDDNDDHCI